MIILYSKSILFSKSCAFVWVEDFWCLIMDLANPHFCGLSPLGTMYDYYWLAFHPREDLSLIANTWHIFSLPFLSIVQLCWTLSHLPSPPNQIQNTVSIYQPCTHTHLMRCSGAYAMYMPLHINPMSHM